ncbi:PIG-L family deacetylase [Owenweeksia hongkongensis]|uniref:PIG-L family deacetylase n=1 Tax=Owenweeksia hongkongensis TaxID=253245 RepID=UPI003A90A7CD
MKKLSLFILLISVGFAFGQKDLSGGEILHELKKLQNPTRVLYLAAHPDDENTRMISWLDNGKGVRTAYLSLTRGDGGQNLIGTELGNKLGVLRSQELMQARKTDGGEQFFSRAIDFGYSKTADETMEKWGEEEILSDVVWVIRTYRPDVIITRFPPDSRGGHGHHTASAMLGIEAFKIAGDPKSFPEQLEFVEPWQPKRIYWNASNWWNKDLDKIAATDDNYVTVDVGGYNALLGASYNEIASYSRTQHKSQGFGVSVARGSTMEYLQYLEGDKADGDIFSGINQTWERYDFKVGDKKLASILENYDVTNPSASLPALFELLAEADKINDASQKEYFKKQLNEIIVASLGWHAELLSDDLYLTPGEDVSMTLEVINRSAQEVSLKSLDYEGQKTDLSEALSANENWSKEINVKVAEEISQPYWLNNPGQNLFTINDQKLRGKAEYKPLPEARLTVDINGHSYDLTLPILNKHSDRVEGEIIEPVFVVPQIVVTPNLENMIFVNDEPQQLVLGVRTFGKEVKSLKIIAQSWNVEPSEIKVDAEVGDFQNVVLTVSPTDKSANDALRIQINGEGEALNLTEIKYSHIDDRVVFEPAQVNLIKVDLKKDGDLIGYIPGAGDKVAEAIELMGYKVETLTKDEIMMNDLSKYKSIVAGIRAYNTQEWLPLAKDKLMNYVQNGGNYIVQYNTSSRDLLSDDIGPYPFEISRDRVTEEDAKVEFTRAKNPVLNTPNKLTDKDFENWVQERGLYFSNKWDDKYETPIGWHDKGEPMREGGLLIGNYGKGAFMYTGISFFRELPAGVPGAYRLLANLLSYQNKADNEQQ